MVDNNLSSWSDPPIDILCAVVVPLLSVCEYKDLVRLSAVCKSWRFIIYRVYLQPIDILCEVANRIQYEELVRLSAVCKIWRFIIYRVYLQLRSPLLMPGLRLPSPYHQDEHGRVINFFDISIQKTRRIKRKIREELRTFWQLDSKYGWIILEKRCKSKPALVLYNPLTNEIIQLPQLNLSTNSVCIATFTSPPTSPDCVIFAFYQVERGEACIVGTCKLGDNIWRFRKITDFKGWKGTNHVTNVTYFNGVFCFVIQRCEPDWAVELGTLDVSVQDWVMDYASITVAQEQYRYMEWYWLVESDEKLLLAVYHGHGDVTMSYWHVYQFDWSRKDWTRVRGLGNQVLILGRHDWSRLTSFACPTSGDDSKLSNMIFCDATRRGALFYTCSSDGVWRIASI